MEDVVTLAEQCMKYHREPMHGGWPCPFCQRVHRIVIRTRLPTVYWRKLNDGEA